MPFIGKDRTLFRLFGLPIKANLSWLFLVALVILTLAQGYFPPRLGEDVPAYLPWVLAVIGAFGLFASLIAHELAHSIVARSTGMPVSGITLFIFGGVSQLEDEPPTAAAEFFMALVGPLSSVIIGSVFLVAMLLGQALGWPQSVQAVLGYLFVINFVLAAFNSLPAFPLDGGRVLRSILWAITKDLRLATQVAAQIGSLFAFGFIIFGLMAAFTMEGGVIFGVWLTIIGFFLRQASLASLQMVVMREQLQGDKVQRFMTTDVVTIPERLSLQEFVDGYVFRHRFTYYPVVDAEGRLAGLVSGRMLRDVDRDQWPHLTIGDVMRQVSPNLVLDPDADAVDALSALRQGEEQRAVVVQDGRPVGIVSLRDLLQFLALKIDLSPRRRG